MIRRRGFIKWYSHHTARCYRNIKLGGVLRKITNAVSIEIITQRMSYVAVI